MAAARSQVTACCAAACTLRAPATIATAAVRVQGYLSGTQAWSPFKHMRICYPQGRAAVLGAGHLDATGLKHARMYLEIGAKNEGGLPTH